MYLLCLVLLKLCPSRLNLPFSLCGISSSLKGNNLLRLRFLKQHVVKSNSIGFADE